MNRTKAPTRPRSSVRVKTRKHSITPKLKLSTMANNFDSNIPFSASSSKENPKTTSNPSEKNDNAQQLNETARAFRNQQNEPNSSSSTSTTSTANKSKPNPTSTSRDNDSTNSSRKTHNQNYQNKKPSGDIYDMASTHHKTLSPDAPLGTDHSTDQYHRFQKHEDSPSFHPTSFQQDSVSLKSDEPQSHPKQPGYRKDMYSTTRRTFSTWDVENAGARFEDMKHSHDMMKQAMKQQRKSSETPGHDMTLARQKGVQDDSHLAPNAACSPVYGDCVNTDAQAADEVRDQVQNLKHTRTSTTASVSNETQARRTFTTFSHHGNDANDGHDDDHIEANAACSPVYGDCVNDDTQVVNELKHTRNVNDTTAQRSATSATPSTTSTFSHSGVHNPTPHSGVHNPIFASTADTTSHNRANNPNTTSHSSVHNPTTSSTTDTTSHNRANNPNTTSHSGVHNPTTASTTDTTSHNRANNPTTSSASTTTSHSGLNNPTTASTSTSHNSLNNPTTASSTGNTKMRFSTQALRFGTNPSKEDNSSSDPLQTHKDFIADRAKTTNDMLQSEGAFSYEEKLRKQGTESQHQPHMTSHTDQKRDQQQEQSTPATASTTDTASHSRVHNPNTAASSSTTTSHSGAHNPTAASTTDTTSHNRATNTTTASTTGATHHDTKTGSNLHHDNILHTQQRRSFASNKYTSMKPTKEPSLTASTRANLSMGTNFTTITEPTSASSSSVYDGDVITMRGNQIDNTYNPHAASYNDSKRITRPNDSESINTASPESSPQQNLGRNPENYMTNRSTLKHQQKTNAMSPNLTDSNKHELNQQFNRMKMRFSTQALHFGNDPSNVRTNSSSDPLQIHMNSMAGSDKRTNDILSDGPLSQSIEGAHHYQQQLQGKDAQHQPQTTSNTDTKRDQQQEQPTPKSSKKWKPDFNRETHRLDDQHRQVGTI